MGGWMTWRVYGAAAVLAALALGSVAFWWRGRPERHLASAERALRDGDADEALEWLPVPEASGRTRERALLLRARVAVERGDVPGAVRALRGVDPHRRHAA